MPFPQASRTSYKTPLRCPETREEMIAFLREHPRYDTMNSWNRAHSYARCVKISHIDWPSPQIRDTAYDMLEVPEAMQAYSEPLRQFDSDQGYLWQHGHNGRSDGYVVLYQGKVVPSNYKSYCTDCGQQNYKTVAETGNNRCGRCGELSRKDYPPGSSPKNVSVFAGRGVDMDDDYDDWDTGTLEERTALVYAFDNAVDAAIAAYAEFCRTHTAVEVEVLVPQTRKIARSVQ